MPLKLFKTKPASINPDRGASMSRKAQRAIRAKKALKDNPNHPKKKALEAELNALVEEIQAAQKALDELTAAAMKE